MPNAATCTTAGVEAQRQAARDCGGLPSRQAQRRSLSDPRTRAGRAVHGHQPRQPVRPPGLDGQPVTGAPTFRQRKASGRTAQSPAALCPERRGDDADSDGCRADNQINYDFVSPRPYSRDILVQGTKGIVRKYPEEKIHVEGRTKGHDWEPLGDYREEYRTSLVEGGGRTVEGRRSRRHGFHRELPPDPVPPHGHATDWDVYDAAAWSAVSALSEQLDRQRRTLRWISPISPAVSWKDRAPLGIVSA